MTMHWIATLPPRSIRLFGNLAGSFVSQFVANRVKRLKADSHLAKRCYEDSLKVGSQPPRSVNPTVNILDLDLDPSAATNMKDPTRPRI
ncbi:hypothetical protein CR513_12795, partial [Mucuna pruriens]